MKKTLFGLAAITMIVAAYLATNAAYDSKADLLMANIEALARTEIPDVTITCGASSGQCWKWKSDNTGCYFSGFQSDFCVYGK